MQHYGPEPQLTGTLSAKNFPADSSVTVVLQDGSVCRFRNAFYHHEGEWIAVYSEHAGYHMFELVAIASVKGMVWEDKDRLALF